MLCAFPVASEHQERCRAWSLDYQTSREAYGLSTVHPVLTVSQKYENVIQLEKGFVTEGWQVLLIFWEP